MNIKGNDLTSCIGIVFSTVALIVIGALMNGWALTLLWLWFIVPIFNAPTLSLVYAIGLSLVVGFMMSKMEKTKSDKKDSFMETFITAAVYTIFTPLIYLFLGFLVKLFI